MVGDRGVDPVPLPCESRGSVRRSPGDDLAGWREFEEVSTARRRQEGIERRKPDLDAPVYRKALGNPGDHHHARPLLYKRQKLRVLGYEGQPLLDGETGPDLRVGHSTVAGGDDVLDLVACLSEATVELERDVLVQQNRQDASLTAGGMWAARWAA